jgi:hypothetical protein
MAKRYANLKPFTQSFPGPRGGSTCFGPGEVREGHWWSRFEGEGGLTEVPGDYNPSRDFKPFGPHKSKPVISPRIIGESTRLATGCSNRCDGACQIACETKCELACENAKQSIQVTEHYEKVGLDFYCRHCDWSTQDPRRVDIHMESYHPELVKQKKGPEGEADSGSWSDGQHAKDPGPEATTSGTGDRAVPARSSPPPRTPPKAENVQENEYWKIIEGQFHCIPCKKELGINWSTAARGAMTRHAKKHHGYETPADRKKKAAKA